jgi:hypothetical protein
MDISIADILVRCCGFVNSGVASNVTQENNSSLKAKSAQKRCKNGLFSGSDKFASTVFQEYGVSVHRNSIMRRYLETADGALSVPDVAISRSFPKRLPDMGISVFLSYAGFDLFLELRETRHRVSRLTYVWNGIAFLSPKTAKIAKNEHVKLVFLCACLC